VTKLLTPVESLNLDCAVILFQKAILNMDAGTIYLSPTGQPFSSKHAVLVDKT